MNRVIPLLLAALCVFAHESHAAPPTATPNILFIIADDASIHFGNAYGCDWVKTPNIDRLAASGLVFENAYTPTSKCAPSRAAILTGRNPWQLEAAGNHQPFFPPHFLTFTEALHSAGMTTGSAGKTWGPGAALTKDGGQRDFALTKTKSAKDPDANLRSFLKARPSANPFFYWFGSANPHRPYVRDSGLAAGKKPSQIDRVPTYWPDTDEVRRDILDYAIEVEAFDTEVGELLKALDEAGERANTIVVVTSDHGMPFPRVKGHTFEHAHHVPLVISWPIGIEKGRRVKEFVSFIDLAPTFLELAKVDAAANGMAPMTGRSLLPLLRGDTDPQRSWVIIGRERNDVACRPGTEFGLGYPARAIREGNLLYVRNFAPERWPCGDPDLGLKDTDDSPTKQLLVAAGPNDRYWQFAFGTRGSEELYAIDTDPDCVRNLADDPALAAKKQAMQKRMMAELEAQADPRVLGKGDVFDDYPSAKGNKGNKTPKGPKL